MRVAVGSRFGRLVAVKKTTPQWSGKQSREAWLFHCDCGNEKVIRGDSVCRGFSQSCGCLQREATTKHGHYAGDMATPTYRSWSSMRSRCLTPSDEHFPAYGGRGISICARWNLFENFLADMGERPKGKTLDRIDVNGDYKPSNCRWATATEQGRNRKINYAGREILLIEACELAGVDYKLAIKRIGTYGWPVERALT